MINLMQIFYHTITKHYFLLKIPNLWIKSLSNWKYYNEEWRTLQPLRINISKLILINDEIFISCNCIFHFYLFFDEQIVWCASNCIIKLGSIKSLKHRWSRRFEILVTLWKWWILSFIALFNLCMQWILFFDLYFALLCVP